MTVKVPFTVTPHKIQGGGFWAEIKEMPGCVAQADTIEELEANLAQAVIDWLQEVHEKTEDEARQLAELQGLPFSPNESYPRAYPKSPPSDWTEEGE